MNDRETSAEIQVVDKQEQLRNLNCRLGSFLSHHVVGWIMPQVMSMS